MLRAYGLAVVVVATTMFAIGAANALAIRAPHYHVNGKALLEKEAIGIKVKVANNFVWTAGGIEVECAQVQANAGATLKGSGAKEPIEDPGTSEETLRFESCIVRNNGKKCKIFDKEAGVEGDIETEPLKNELVYLEKPAEKPVKGTRLGVYYIPVTGVVIAKFFLDNECETVKGKQKIEGSLAGLTQIQAEMANKLVAFEENELEATAKCEETKTCNIVLFPKAQITSVWRIEKGKAKEAIVKVAMFEKAATFLGEALVTSEKAWGVFAAK